MRGIRRSSSAPSPTCGTIRNGEPVDHGDGPPPPKPARITSVSAAPYSVALGTSVQFNGAAVGSGPLASVEFRRWKRRDGAFLPPHLQDLRGKHAARLRVSNEAGTDARTVTIRVARHTRQEQEARNRPAEPSGSEARGNRRVKLVSPSPLAPASSTGPCPLAAALPDGTAKPPHSLVRR